MHRYSDEEKDFLKDVALGNSYDKITELFNNQFKVSLPKSSVMSTCFRYGYKNELDCKFNKGYEPTQFKKGHSPVNKGIKGGYMKANKTSFQKGSVPANYRPVGSERLTVDGYTEIKIADHQKWKMKHVIVWENANGTVPKGYVVIFADGNRQNSGLSNLVLVSRKELAIMNKRGLISDNADLTKTGVIVADVYLKIGEKKRNG